MNILNFFTSLIIALTSFFYPSFHNSFGGSSTGGSAIPCNFSTQIVSTSSRLGAQLSWTAPVGTLVYVSATDASGTVYAGTEGLGYLPSNASANLSQPFITPLIKASTTIELRYGTAPGATTTCTVNVQPTMNSTAIAP